MNNIKTQSLLILAFICGVMQAPRLSQFPGTLGEMCELLPDAADRARLLDILHIPHNNGAVDGDRVISVNHALDGIKKNQDETRTISEFFSLGAPSAELHPVFSGVQFDGMSTGGTKLILNLRTLEHDGNVRIRLVCNTKGIESSKEFDLGHLPAILASPQVAGGTITMRSSGGSELISPEFKPLSIDQLVESLEAFFRYLEIEDAYMKKADDDKVLSAGLAAEYGAARVSVRISGIDIPDRTFLDPASRTVADFLREMHLTVGEPAHVTQNLVFNGEIVPPHLHFYDLLKPGQAEPHNLTCRLENQYILNILRSSDQIQFLRDGVVMNYPELLQDQPEGYVFEVRRKQGDSDFASFKILKTILDRAQPRESALRNILVIMTQALDIILEISITGKPYTAKHPRVVLDPRFHVKHKESTVELILKHPLSERGLELHMPQYGSHEPEIREYVEYYVLPEIAEKI